MHLLRIQSHYPNFRSPKSNMMINTSSCSYSASIKTQNTDFITEDIYLAIFLYLPLNSIYIFRSVSKVWLSLLTNPSFINKWIQFNRYNKSLPWIIYHSIGTHKDHNLSYGYRFKKLFLFSHSNTLKPQFILGNQDGFSFDFLNPKPNEFLLSSSNGLVLCIANLVGPMIYYVCNPLTEEWVMLPPPPTMSTWVNHGFICESVTSTWLGCTSCYKVVRIPQSGVNGNKFKIEIFSSDLGEWYVYDVFCPADIIFDVAHIQTPVVTRSEVLYWMEGRSRIVVYDLNNNGDTGSCRCTLIDLPDLQWGDSYMEELRYDKDHTHCLGESEGLLCYARIMRNQRTLSVWVLEDNKWCLLHKDIDLHDIFAEMSNKSYEVESEQEEQQEEDEGMNVEEEDEGMIVEEEQDGEEALMAVHVLCFNPVDKDVVFLSYNNCVWAFHTRTKRYEELSLPSFLAGMHSTYRYRIFFPFVLNPLPTILPPPSWMDTTVELS